MKERKVQNNLKKSLNYLKKIGYQERYGRIILKLYAKHIKVDERLIGDAVQNDFKAFLDFYGTIKSKFKNKRTWDRRRIGYDEWFQQSQLDGSFAYNNSADDF